MIALVAILISTVELISSTTNYMSSIGLGVELSSSGWVLGDMGIDSHLVLVIFSIGILHTLEGMSRSLGDVYRFLGCVSRLSERHLGLARPASGRDSGNT
jgi:hypothetical protein